MLLQNNFSALLNVIHCKHYSLATHCLTTVTTATMKSHMINDSRPIYLIPLNCYNIVIVNKLLESFHYTFNVS
jgi:hypothetical protein